MNRQKVNTIITMSILLIIATGLFIAIIVTEINSEPEFKVTLKTCEDATGYLNLTEEGIDNINNTEYGRDYGVRLDKLYCDGEICLVRMTVKICHEEEVDLITYDAYRVEYDNQSGKYYDKLVETSHVPLKDLTTEWLRENAECKSYSEDYYCSKWEYKIYTIYRK